jgi:hypothetical protein
MITSVPFPLGRILCTRVSCFKVNESSPECSGLKRTWTSVDKIDVFRGLCVRMCACVCVMMVVDVSVGTVMASLMETVEAVAVVVRWKSIKTEKKRKRATPSAKRGGINAGRAGSECSVYNNKRGKRVKAKATHCYVVLV